MHGHSARARSCVGVNDLTSTGEVGRWGVSYTMSHQVVESIRRVLRVSSSF